MAKKKPRVLKEIDPEFLEAARENALKGNKFSAKQIAEFSLLWGRQEMLPKDMRQLRLANLGESGWVLTHLIQVSGESLITRIKPDIAEKDRIEKLFAQIKDTEVVDIEIFYNELKNYRHIEEVSLLLPIVELGLLGLHVLAAVIAQSYGLIDLTTTLIADGTMKIQDVIKTSELLGEEFRGSLSTHDLLNGSVIWIPPELYSPDNFDS